MKKICTFVVLSCLISSVSFAQSGSNVKFGVKAGVNLATVSTNESGVDPKSVTSFHFGGYADIPVSSAFSVQPGLTISGKGFKYEETGIKFTRDVMYLEIPVNAVYKISNFYIGAGPYAAFGISGKDKTKIAGIGEDSEDVKFGSEVDKVKALDFGVNFLAGYQLQNNINFGVGYGLGLSNTVGKQTTNESIKNRVFSISVGYSF